jgi:hypothetical protein
MDASYLPSDDGVRLLHELVRRYRAGQGLADLR